MRDSPSDVFFDWEEEKDLENRRKHGISFGKAQYAFRDPKRVIIEDEAHSSEEQRYFCVGKVGREIMTVRFTYRGEGDVIRIFGANYWSDFAKIYREINP